MFRLYILIIFLIFSLFFLQPSKKNISSIYFSATPCTTVHCGIFACCCCCYFRLGVPHSTTVPTCLSPSLPHLHFESRAACLFVKTFFVLRALGLCVSAAAAAPPGRHLFIINSSCKLQNVYSGANTRRPLLICSLFRCLFVLR